jgi:RNA polymerase sigma-70 factor, ECF subfamily
LDDAETELPDLPPPSTERLDRDNILAALSRVDDRFQSAVALFYLEDYSYPEIAQVLEIPLGTVKSRISRGIAQLQGLLRESQPEAARG